MALTTAASHVIPKWRSVDTVRKETLDYMLKRKNGLITSLSSPWPKLNKALLDGLEWGGIYVIAGRPGSGKTTVVSQLSNYAHIHNPGLDFVVLNFQFEMTDRIIGVRELTKPMNMTMNQLFSADPTMKLTDDHIRQIQEWHRMKEHQEIFYITEPLTAKEIKAECIKFHNHFKKPMIVTIDHSVLTKRHLDEQSQIDTLYALSTELVSLKKLLPDSLYIVLSQMNRTIEDPKRRENGAVGNFPTASDIFGADALMQNADVTIAISRPDLLGIKYYGPDQIPVKNGMMIFHLIKNRFGEQEMLFFEQDLKYFEIKEGASPILKKLSTK